MNKMSNTVSSPALNAPPVMNNTPQPTSRVACLWVWGHNYCVSSAFWNAEIPSKFLRGMHTLKGLYTNSVRFFLFERLWKSIPLLLSSPTTKNLRMYRMMSDINRLMKGKGPDESLQLILKTAVHKSHFESVLWIKCVCPCFIFPM